MAKPEIQSLTDFALKLAAASAEQILSRFRSPMNIQIKAATDWDPVTEADKAAERVMRQLIEEAYPDHGILGEEYGTKVANSDFTWILDPIDGTRAFVIGLPTWATLIGLYYRGQPLLGIMNQPYVGDMFIGSPDGAWKDRRGHRVRLKTANPTALKNAKIGTTTPHRYVGQDAAGFERLRESVTLMRYGGDAYFFCLLAEGLLDAAMDPDVQIYDIAALIPIIKGAGGVVSTWDGSDPVKGGNFIAASSQTVMDDALAKMAR